MERFRVFIATTSGPCGVLSLSREDPDVHSVICVDGSEQDLPISPAYHRFVRDPTGVIERAFRHPAWRMDVDGPIDAGNSWKLGVLTAHALEAAGRLARADDTSAAALWLTGDVTRDLSVRSVGHIPRKLSMSADLFARLRAHERGLRLFVPASDAGDVDPDLASELDIAAVADADAVMQAVGLASLGAGPAPGDTRAPVPAIPGAGLDFSAILQEKRRDFTGRRWILDDIEAWRAGATREPALLILGDPGSGKSALAARLTETGVFAAHVCQSDAQVTLDAGRFVQSVAQAALAQLPASAPSIAATAEFLTRDACRMDPASAMDFGLIPLLAALPRDGPRAVILVDALDESLSAGGRLTIAELLADRLDRLPDGVVLVATSRSDPRILDRFRSTRKLQLQPADPRNLADLRDYVAARASAETADWICQWAEGNFLYARQVLDSIARGNDILAGGGDMPRGLESLYLRLFNRHWPQGAGFSEAHDVLALILAAREPLSAGQIHAVRTHAGGGAPHAMLEKLGPVLRSDGRRLEIFHTSLGDWLTHPEARAGPFCVDRKRGEDALTRWCLAWRDHSDAYALRNAAAHLRAAGQVEPLADLVEDSGFAALKARLGSIDLARWTDLVEYAGALLDARRDAEAVRFATDSAPDRAAALTAAAIDLDDPLRIRAIAQGLLSAPNDVPIARINAVRAGVTLAARIGDDAALARLARDRQPAVRAALVVGIYAYWRRSGEAGWDLLDRLGQRLFSRIGLPDPRIIDVLGGVSLAIVARHLDTPDTMARLHAFWRAVVRHGIALPAARLLGQGWVTALAVPSLRLLLARQPDYQPLNIAEIDHAVQLTGPHAALRARAIDLIEAPGAGPGALARDLSDPDLRFDIVHVLAAERALILTGKADPDATFAVLETLADRGRPWFRQSILYAGFHIVAAVDRPARHLDHYLALSRAILQADRGLYETPQGRYQMIPHFAWPEVLRSRLTGDLSAGEITRHAQAALAQDDFELAVRIAGAAEILSLGYGLHSVALRGLSPLIGAEDPGLAAAVRRTLANIRFHAQDEVDRLIQEGGDVALSRQIAATVPTVSAADFPTWIDALFVRLLLNRPAFRGQVARTFRQAAGATRSRHLLAHVVPWVAALLVD